MKKCPKCGIVKSLDEFHKSKDKKDGLKSHCKKCVAVHSKIYAENNRIKIRETQKIWENKNKDRVKTYQKKYYENNKNKIYEKNRKYKHNNPEIIRKHHRDYYYRHHNENLTKRREARKTPEYKKKAAARDSIYQKNNREKCNLHKQKYRDKFKDIIYSREYFRRHACKNPTNEMIKLKCQHLIIRRRIKQIKQGENNEKCKTTQCR